jgi:hypothetical protein
MQRHDVRLACNACLHVFEWHLPFSLDLLDSDNNRCRHRAGEYATVNEFHRGTPK